MVKWIYTYQVGSSIYPLAFIVFKENIEVNFKYFLLVEQYKTILHKQMV